MRNLSELSINEGGMPVTRAAPSERIIQEFEKQFGLKCQQTTLHFSGSRTAAIPNLT